MVKDDEKHERQNSNEVHFFFWSLSSPRRDQILYDINMNVISQRQRESEVPRATSMAVHRHLRTVVVVVVASSRGSCATGRKFRPVPLQRRTQSSWLPDWSESAGGDRALLAQHLRLLADVSGCTAALPCREVSEMTCFSSALGLTDPNLGRPRVGYHDSARLKKHTLRVIRKCRKSLVPPLRKSAQDRKCRKS